MEYQIPGPSEQDKANVLLTQAQAIRQLRDAGYEAESVVQAVQTGELSRLVPGSRA